MDRSLYGHFLIPAHPALGETCEHRRLRGEGWKEALLSPAEQSRRRGFLLRAMEGWLAGEKGRGAGGAAGEKGRGAEECLSMPRCDGPTEDHALCAAGRAGALVPAKKTNAFPLSPGNASTAPAERVHFKAR